MNHWKERLVGARVIRGCLDSWSCDFRHIYPRPRRLSWRPCRKGVKQMDRVRGIFGQLEAHVVVDALALGLLAVSVALLGSLIV
jgi:hypothetical protein